MSHYMYPFSLRRSIQLSSAAFEPGVTHFGCDRGAKLPLLDGEAPRSAWEGFSTTSHKTCIYMCHGRSTQLNQLPLATTLYTPIASCR